MQTRKTFNPKRRIRSQQGDRLVSGTPTYTGHPDHKRNPGDFGLSPPSSPRLGASLCDDAGITTRSNATALLMAGWAKGMVSEREANGWPQNIWAVTATGVALEAQHEGSGRYHGYPMPAADPLREVVLSRWRTP